MIMYYIYNMKKHIRFTCLFLICMLRSCLGVMAQTVDTATTIPNGSNAFTPSWRWQDFGGRQLPWEYNSAKGKYYLMATTQWTKNYVATSVGNFPITVTKSTFTVGSTFNNLNDLLADISQSQPPLVTFTPGSSVLELTSAPTGTASLNYTYSKQTGTNDFTSLQFTSSAGGSSTIGATAGGGSGTYSASFPTNVTTTFTFRANTTDKFATATATVSYSARRYWGRAPTGTPTTTDILNSSGGSSALSSSKAGTFVITASGTNYPFFAYPSSLGTLTSIKDANGLEAITSYNTGTVSLTNGQGFTQTYRYYVAQNATAGNTTMVTQ